MQTFTAVGGDSGSFIFETYVESLKEQEVKTVEGALEFLKKEHPSFFEEYILMYNSRSLQTSSYFFPRALLISPDSSVVISFNGDPKDNAYNNLEFMLFDSEKKFFYF